MVISPAMFLSLKIVLGVFRVFCGSMWILRLSFHFSWETVLEFWRGFIESVDRFGKDGAFTILILKCGHRGGYISSFSVAVISQATWKRKSSFGRRVSEPFLRLLRRHGSRTSKLRASTLYHKHGAEWTGSDKTLSSQVTPLTDFFQLCKAAPHRPPHTVPPTGQVIKRSVRWGTLFIQITSEVFNLLLVSSSISKFCIKQGKYSWKQVIVCFKIGDREGVGCFQQKEVAMFEVMAVVKCHTVLSVNNDVH